MEPAPPPRLYLVIAVLAGVALVGNAVALFRTRNLSPNVPMFVYEQRMGQLEPTLPRVERMGYLTDVLTHENTERLGVYHGLTQYFLAPRVLTFELGHDLVIGDFHDRVPSAAALADTGLYSTRSTTNGVVIYQRPPR